MRFGIFPTGTVKKYNGGGNATYAIKVKGPKTSRYVHINLDRKDGVWDVSRLVCTDEKGVKQIFYSDDPQIAEEIQDYESQEGVVRSYDHLQKNQLNEALDESGEAIDKNPRNSEAYFWRAKTYLKMKKEDEAIADFISCIDLDPGFVSAYNELSLLYGQRGEYEESLDYINQSLELEPDNGWAYYHRGATLYRMERFEEALNNVEYACSLGYEQGCKTAERFKNKVP
jgi:tetratricopeptide (TPR) repeat protein